MKRRGRGRDLFLPSTGLCAVFWRVFCCVFVRLGAGFGCGFCGFLLTSGRVFFAFLRTIPLCGLSHFLLNFWSTFWRPPGAFSFQKFRAQRERNDVAEQVSRLSKREFRHFSRIAREEGCRRSKFAIFKARISKFFAHRKRRVMSQK